MTQTRETRAGWKSTEFWIVVTVLLADLITGLTGVLPPEWAGASATVVTVLYAVSRGLAKHGVPNS